MTTASTGGGEANSYSAGPSALGYLAQVEFALLLVLRRLDLEIEFEVSLETLDDIVFHDGADAVELLQSKHHVERQAALTDASTDVWKTLHNWIDAAATHEATLTLMTTAMAPPGSAMAHLRDGADRDVVAALTALESLARTSQNQSHQPYYQSFLNLSSNGRSRLLARVTVVDGALPVTDVNSALELAVRKATRASHRIALIERLRGWWYRKVYDHLTRVASGERDRILSAEVEAQLLALAQKLRDDDLPIDFLDMPEPTDQASVEDERVFVHQLRLIALGSARLRQCIYDHNRAFAQRSMWEREKLLHVGELKEYETRLKEEWRRYCLPETDDESVDDPDLVAARARERFLLLDRSALPRIRTHVEAEYVGSGSLHILADRLEIGWHPDWLARIRELLPELGSSTGEGAA